jgi:hypothetical protein
MKRFAPGIAIGLTLVFLGWVGASTASSQPNPCTGPYDPVPASVQPDVDVNGNGTICQAHSKKTEPFFKDDRLPKGKKKK